jgi:3'(2'), 5'-bisphosphate nucleotidase
MTWSRSGERPGSRSTNLVTADDHAIAAQLAAEAGKVLLELRDREAHLPPKALGRAGDTAAHDFLVARLAELRPDDSVLSEEGRNDLSRLSNRRVWIVDPLDGTREFADIPRDDWAVHVALVVDGEALAGAVALPARAMTLASDPPPAPLPPFVGSPRVVVSRSRPPLEAEWIAQALGGHLVSLGSAGAKAMAVVLGQAELYAHAGGQYEWDSAAPVAVASATGLHASRIDGSALKYNQPDPRLPDLVVCRKDLAPRLLASLRRIAG